MKVFKVGIIGAGRIGKVHAESLCYHVPNAMVKSIADPFLNDATKEWAKSLGIENAYTDHKDILSDPEIDAVFVCSSTDTHSQISIESMEAGKHVFCEKPIDFDLDRIAKVLETVEKTGVKFQVGFNRRFDHNFKAVKEAVAAGKIGEPHIIKVSSRDPQAPPVSYVKVSGGIFLDMTIHDFDMVRYLSGSEVTEVNAIGGVLVDPGIGEAGDIDTAIITLKLENGCMAVIDNSRQALYGYDQRAEVFGSKGMVEAANDTPSTAVVSTADGIVAQNIKSALLDRYLQAYVDEAKAFIKAVAEDTEVTVKGIDGLKPVLIGLAATKSLKEGRPVKISEIEK